MTIYKPKAPAAVDAVLWLGDPVGTVRRARRDDFVEGDCDLCGGRWDTHGIVPTFTGPTAVCSGLWVVRHPDGGVWVMDSSRFQADYEQVLE